MTTNLPPLTDAAREAAAVRIAYLYYASEDAEGCDTGVMWEEFSTLYTTLTGRPLGYHPDDLGNMDAEYDASRGDLPCQLPETVTPDEWAEIMTEADEAGSHIDEEEVRADGSTRYVLAVPIGGGWDRRAYVVRDGGAQP